VDVKALTPVPVGTYVYIRFVVRDPITYEERVREVVGLIGSSLFKSVVPIVTTQNLTTYERTSPLSSLKSESYMKALIIADITGGRVEAPRYPPPPETPVYLARPEHVGAIYRNNPETSVEIGSLVGFEDLRIRVNINALTKHLLITGTTGSGKSNLVAVLADRVAGIGGSVVIFDVHGEYGDLISETPGKVSIVKYEAAINPIELPISLLVSFIIPEGTATKQRRILRNVLKDLNDKIRERSVKSRKPYSLVVKEIYKESHTQQTLEDPVDMYKDLLIRNIKFKSQDKDEKSVTDVVDKVEDFFEWRRIDLEARKISELLGNSKVVVVDVSAFTDEEKDYMLKVVAEDLLWYLKEGLRKGLNVIPTLLIIEEAHIFLSSDNTKSKGTLQRFIREGRKFGGMLVIVSQRPRALDINVVSQIQNYVFLKLVQSKDRATVMEITDILSDDYVNILPTLPPGYGLIMGEWIGKYPAYVRIDKHEGKRAGATPDVVSIWREGMRIRSKSLEVRSLSSEWEG